MTRKLPSWIPGSVRQWRALKRRQWRAIQRALDEFRQGCAYTPLYRDFQTGEHAEIEQALKRGTELLRGNWDPVSSAPKPRGRG